MRSPPSCYSRALDALARRSRSRADLVRWLTQREYPAAEIEAALDKLEALGLLSDLAFARGFARSRLASARGFGPRRVRTELARHGVARDVIEQVMAEEASQLAADAEDADGEGPSRAGAVAARKLASLRDLDPTVARRRLYGYLARRGYEPDEIMRAIASAMTSASPTAAAGRFRR